MDNLSTRILAWLAILLLSIPVAGELVARALCLPGVSDWNDPIRFCNPIWDRAHGTFRRHKDYFWTFSPGIQLRCGGSGGAENVIHIDTFGFRLTPWDHRGEDGIRWMFLGDSMVFGWEAPDGETFPDAVLSTISERYQTDKLASANLGVPAYSSYQSLKTLRGEFARVRPDVVVYWGGSNDNAPANGCPDRVFARLYSGPMYHLRRALDKSAFIRWTRTLRGARPAPRPKQVWNPAEAYARRVEPEEYAKNIRGAQRYCQQRQTRFLAITRQHVVRDAGLVRYNDVLEMLSEEGEVTVVDIRDLYVSAVDNELMSNYPDDIVHFNSKGYQLVAERVVARIEYERWVDALIQRKRGRG